MKRNLCVFFCVLTTVLLKTASGQNHPLFQEEIKPGLEWSYYSIIIDGSQQSINVLVIDPEKVSLDVVSNGKELKSTSEFGKERNSVAAINGSFFNMKEGGSVVFYQNEGIVEGKTTHKREFTDEAGFGIREKTAIIYTKPKKGWKKTRKYVDLLSSGPLLLNNNKKVQLREDTFHITRHPRTAVGIRNDGSIVFTVVDGRHRNARGMSIEELRNWMSYLNCTLAMNLDGGGSSTLWLNGRSENGVVNYPSDNMQFDHLGERKVANAIIIY